LLCTVDQAKERRVLVGRGHAPEGDDHPPAGSRHHFLNKGYDIAHEVRYARSKRNIASDVCGGQPVRQDGAGVGDARLGRARLELGEHAGRGVHIDHLAAAQGQRQTDPSGTAANIDEDVIRLHVGGDDLQVGVQAAVWITAKALCHRAAKAVLLQLVAVDAETLGIDGINAGGIGVGSSHSWSPGVPWHMRLMWPGKSLFRMAKSSPTMWKQYSILAWRSYSQKTRTQLCGRGYTPALA
jgi:hypothetical protein